MPQPVQHQWLTASELQWKGPRASGAGLVTYRAVGASYIFSLEVYRVQTLVTCDSPLGHEATSDLFLSAWSHLQLLLLHHRDQGVMKFTSVFHPCRVSLPDLFSHLCSSLEVSTMELVCALALKAMPHLPRSLVPFQTLMSCQL